MTEPRKRILLSVPHMSGREAAYVAEAFSSNWVSTVGPNLDRFEADFSALIGRPSVAVSSGTAAIHLGLRLLGVGEGDEVLCPTLTFVATANPIRYLGARPVFLDSERRSWNVDPQLIRDTLERRARQGQLPKAVIVVHLFGQCADMAAIGDICSRWDVPVLEDAAEALGATCAGRPAGGFGACAAFSFNGNKMITTSGGGMLVAAAAAAAARARFWAQQARQPALAYEHAEMGYNYRLSNVLAGIGRGQLEVLEERVAARRAVQARYRAGFADLDGLTPMPEAGWGRHTHWLSCFLVDEARFGRGRDELIARLDAAGIESRPVWKPMHLQPLYKSAERIAGDVAEDLFRRGICLPSSSSLAAAEQRYVIDQVRAAAVAPPVDCLEEDLQTIP